MVEDLNPGQCSNTLLLLSHGEEECTYLLTDTEHNFSMKVTLQTSHSHAMSEELAALFQHQQCVLSEHEHFAVVSWKEEGGVQHNVMEVLEGPHFEAVNDTPHIMPKGATVHGLKADLKVILEETIRDQEVYNKVLSQLENSTASKASLHQTKLILQLFRNLGITGTVMEEVLKGAHVKLYDDGKIVDTLSRSPLLYAQSRFSSHYNDGMKRDEFGISVSDLLPELLIFKHVEDGNNVVSHFQLENSPWRGTSMVEGVMNSVLHNGLGHVIDFVCYGVQKVWLHHLLGQDFYNLGPYGWSIQHDHNPIHVEIKNITNFSIGQPLETHVYFLKND